MNRARSAAGIRAISSGGNSSRAPAIRAIGEGDIASVGNAEIPDARRVDAEASEQIDRRLGIASAITRDDADAVAPDAGAERRIEAIAAVGLGQQFALPP